MNNTPHRPEPPVVAMVQNLDNRGEGANRLVVKFDAAPYPEVKGAHNPRTIAMLKEDYAGAESELSAITQYIFQNTTTDDEAFANAMLQIAIVEMTHLDMLGDAIHALGGTTEFKSDGKFWTAENVNYSSTKEGMLRANIEGEQIAIENYRRHAAQTDNHSVRDLLLRIVRDEELHLAFFERLLAEEHNKNMPVG
jgi:bacterioferritin